MEVHCHSVMTHNGKRRKRRQGETFKPDHDQAPKQNILFRPKKTKKKKQNDMTWSCYMVMLFTKLSMSRPLFQTYRCHSLSLSLYITIEKYISQTYGVPLNSIPQTPTLAYWAGP